MSDCGTEGNSPKLANTDFAAWLNDIGQAGGRMENFRQALDAANGDVLELVRGLGTDSDPAPVPEHVVHFLNDHRQFWPLFLSVADRIADGPFELEITIPEDHTAGPDVLSEDDGNVIRLTVYGDPPPQEAGKQDR